MQSKYGTAIDRESAYELLNAKFQAGAEAAAAEAAAAQQAKADAAAAKEQAAWEKEQARLEREAAPRTTARAPRREKSFFEQLTENTMVRQMARSAAREITRSIFGTGRRR